MDKKLSGGQPGKKTIDTILAQAGTHYGSDVVGLSSKDVVPPIHLSTTFERDADGRYSGNYVYSRHNNPTRALLEKVMVEIEEGAEFSAAFSSGMQAANVILQALGGPKSFVLIPNDLYHGVRTLVHSLAENWDLPFATVDMTNLEAVKVALEKAFADSNTTRVLVFMESPSNPLLEITDVPAVLDLIQEIESNHENKKDVITILDTTWYSPYLIQGISIGVDLTFNSATKFLGGHSDLLGGVVTGRRSKTSGSTGRIIDLEQPIRHIQMTAGGVLSPFDAWLLLRGLKTLPCRMRVHCENAFKLAHFFSTHPSISKTHYPGLQSHPGHAQSQKVLAREGLWGSMMSIQIKGGKEAAFKALAKLQVFRRATSLGSTESLCEHRRSVEGPLSTTPEDLIRLSVGLEAYQDLEEDWRQALEEVAP